MHTYTFHWKWSYLCSQKSSDHTKALCTALYSVCVLLHFTVSHYILSHCIVLHCIVLHYIVLHCTALYIYIHTLIVLTCTGGWLYTFHTHPHAETVLSHNRECVTEIAACVAILKMNGVPLQRTTEEALSAHLLHLLQVADERYYNSKELRTAAAGTCYAVDI